MIERCILMISVVRSYSPDVDFESMYDDIFELLDSSDEESEFICV